MSSSWRWGYWSSGKDRLEYLELIEKLAEFDISIRDITPAFTSNNREAEILWWLKNNFEEGNFIILDDEENYFNLLSPYLVLTDKALGLTMTQVDKAIEMLNERSRVKSASFILTF